MTSLKPALPIKLLSASTAGFLFLGLGASAAVASEAEDNNGDNANIDVVSNIIETEHLLIESRTVPGEHSDLRVGVPVTWEVEVVVKDNESASLDTVLNYSADFSSEIDVQTDGTDWVQSDNDTATAQQTWRAVDYVVNTDGTDNETMLVTTTLTPEDDLLPEQNASMSLTVIARDHDETEEDDSESTPSPSPSPSPEPSPSPGEPEPGGDEADGEVVVPVPDDEVSDSQAEQEQEQDRGQEGIEDGIVGGEDVLEQVTVLPDGGTVHGGEGTFVDETFDSPEGSLGDDTDSGLGDGADIESGVIPNDQSNMIGYAMLGLLGVGLVSGAVMLWRKRVGNA